MKWQWKTHYYMPKKTLGRALLGFIVLNMLVVFPLIWIVGSYVPDRLDVYVSGTKGNARVLAFRAGVGMDRLVNFSFVDGGMQRLKMYFNAGCPVESLEFGFENGPVSFSMERMTVMQRCVLMRTLQARDFLMRYEILGDCTVKANDRGGLDFELNGAKVRFKPKRFAAGAWALTLGSDGRLVALWGMAELGLLLLCLVVTSLLGKENDQWRTIAAKSASVGFVTALLFLVALPVQSYLTNRSSFPFPVDALLTEVFIRFASYGILLTVVLLVLHAFFAYVPHCVVLGVVVYEYLVTGVMSMGLPPLNGELAWWVGFDGRALIELAIGVLVVVLFVCLRRFVARHMHAVSGVTLLMIVASMFDVKIEKGAVADDERICDFEDVVRSAVYSSKRNIFVFILDAAPTPSCARVFDESAELRELFPGFVQCRNNLSMGECTSTGLPGLATGLFQGVEEDEFDYAYSFFGTNSFIVAASSIMPTYFIPGLGTRSFCSRLVPKVGEAKRVRQEYAESVFDVDIPGCIKMNLGEVVKFRTAPLMFKLRLIHVWLSGMDRAYSYCDESTLYQHLEEAGISSLVPLTLHVYHTSGMHPPLNIDRNYMALANPDNTPDGLRAVSYAKLRRLGELLGTFRRRGIYDNSLILVCGDHGNILEPPVREVGKEPLPTRAFALLMVKPVGAKGAFSHDDSTPTGHCAIKRLIEAEIREGPVGRVKALSLLTESNRIYRERDMEWLVNDSMTDSTSRKWRP